MILSITGLAKKRKRMTNRTISLTNKLYDYLLSVSLREPPFLQELRKETQKLSSHNMQIAPEQGQFMAFLVQLIKAQKTIDIGVYTGYSSSVVALALPSDGKVVACDINSEWIRIAEKYWEKGDIRHKIDLRLAPALETLNDLIEKGEANTFDFIFIDADKKNYINYYEKGLELLRPGGVIAIDNVLWGGDVINSNDQSENTLIIRQLNERIYHDKRVSLTLLPIADGLTLVSKKAKVNKP